MPFPLTPGSRGVPALHFGAPRRTPVLHLSAGSCRGQQHPLCSPALLGEAGKSAAVPEALLLPQPHTVAESFCSLLATSEPTEAVRVPVGNILSACPDHDNPKHHPVRLFWASFPSEPGVQCQGDMPSHVDIMPAPPAGSPESRGWLQSLQADLFLSP